MPDGQQPEKLTVSYTGCGNFSLRHHSSRHILGVIWGGYALLGKGGETVKAHSPLLLYPLARATNQPLIGATGTGETELLGCCPEAFVPTPFLFYQQLQPRFLSKGKMGFCMLRIMSAHMRTPSSPSCSQENSLQRPEGSLCLSRMEVAIQGADISSLLSTESICQVSGLSALL